MQRECLLPGLKLDQARRLKDLEREIFFDQLA
jgi:hypothetical protein